MSPERPGRPRPGWAAYVEETPAAAIVAMPTDLAKKVANYIAALALEAGAALDRGRRPPGDAMGDHGTRFSIQVAGEPVLIEYSVHHDIRAIRIPVVVWID
ncbi:hypothetical protein ACI2L4_41010 [Streptomyces sparsogenes]|uniref:Plasmid stabilization system n=2 Tax=Streptomyces TaxID=1883 RepID=A0A1R1SCI8_9ACTN|nr:hypothetical protein [Streptomyces sparsogenes]OMI35927.1 hypothetical protein SPAR_28766 [Streptomyces sparsogenes DSM 40356]